jgi:hypothetical protein
MSFGTDLLAGLRGVRDRLESDADAALPAAEHLLGQLEPLAEGDTTVLESAAVDLVKRLGGDVAASVESAVPAVGTAARLDALEARAERIEHLIVPPAKSVLPAAAEPDGLVNPVTEPEPEPVAPAAPETAPAAPAV